MGWRTKPICEIGCCLKLNDARVRNLGDVVLAVIFRAATGLAMTSTAAATLWASPASSSATFSTTGGLIGTDCMGGDASKLQEFNSTTGNSRVQRAA